MKSISAGLPISARKTWVLVTSPCCRAEDAEEGHEETVRSEEDRRELSGGFPKYTNMSLSPETVSGKRVFADVMEDLER